VDFLQIVLPSGRSLYYREPGITKDRWNRDAVYFMGIIRPSGKWGRVSAYGGKWSENIIQAAARDLLANSMLELWKNGYDVGLHVHDEIGIEGKIARAEATLKALLSAMLNLPDWAYDLPIGAEGFNSTYYKKD
jgi:DNA polymerase